MAKYAAIIELGWVNKRFEADDACGIMRQVEEYQDFDCLLSMGPARENKKGREELKKLSRFIDKYHDGSLTREDIRDLDVHLSAGNFICHGIELV